MSSLYPKLLSPITLGGRTLRNRCLMGSMHVGMEEDRDYSGLAAYFAARAAGGVGLIVTGGIAPNRAGWLKPFAAKLSNQREVRKHRLVTEAVHAEGGHIALQILHAGRYGYHPFCVAPSKIRSPISPFKPRALSARGVESTIQDFVRCAVLAQEAGYDGVEIMGSEGYLINQFIVTRTNERQDQWGGDYRQRIQFPLEIVRRTREAVGPDFILIYRLSMLDLVPQGSTWDEVVELAKGIEEAGASLINTGIGWHEARVPTIATRVPRAAFTWVTRRLKEEVSLPLVTSNRINTPEIAEEVLERGDADLVSMARPLLADPDFMRKAAEGRADRINTCIACNQACLDHAFQNKRASCLVNPLACHELELRPSPASRPRRVAVVGGGPAGMACACAAAERGHEVTLFEARDTLGGQFLLAERIPGKEEFAETLRYFSRRLEDSGVTLRLGERAEASELRGFDEVVLASGVRPRELQIPGADHPSVLAYDEVLRGAEVGERVAIIGAGGVGFDVAEFLTHPGGEGPPDLGEFLREWGVDTDYQHRGGLQEAVDTPSPRRVWLLQRKAERLGKRLGKTTGWIHRAGLRKRGVEMLGGVQYEQIDDRGLHILEGGQPRLLEVDHVVVCAGQVSELSLEEPLKAQGVSFHRIGGARVAGELDAKRAIREGVELAHRL